MKKLDISTDLFVSLSSLNYFIKAAVRLHVKMLFNGAASTLHVAQWFVMSPRLRRLLFQKTTLWNPDIKVCRCRCHTKEKTNRNKSVSFNGNSLSNVLCSLHLRSLCLKTPPVLWLHRSGSLSLTPVLFHLLCRKNYRSMISGLKLKELLEIHDVDTVNTVQLGENHPFLFLFFFQQD